MKTVYKMYDESNGTYHKWQARTVISKANKWIEYFNTDAEEGERLSKVTTVDDALAFLEDNVRIMLDEF